MGMFDVIDYLYDTDFVRPNMAEPVYKPSDNEYEEEMRMTYIMCFMKYVNHLKSSRLSKPKLSITQC